MDLGLCLSGGGVKGAAHIGALKAFEEENISFNFISGTSSGSIVAALYAVGYDSDEILNLFKKYCKKIGKINFRIIIKSVFDFLINHKFTLSGLNTGSIIEKIVSKACNEKNINNISEIKKSLLIPSVDLHNGNIYCFASVQPRTFSDNIIYKNNISIGKAVRASCTFPRIFCSF